MPTISGYLCSVGNYPNTLCASARRSHKLQITSPTPVQSLDYKWRNRSGNLRTAAGRRSHSAQLCCCWQTREDALKRELPKSVSREDFGMYDVSQSSNRNNLPLQNSRRKQQPAQSPALHWQARSSARKPEHNPPPSAGQLLSGADSDKHPGYLCHRR